MKCNIREIALMSDKPCLLEGRLNYKKVSNGSYRNQAGIIDIIQSLKKCWRKSTFTLVLA